MGQSKLFSPRSLSIMCGLYLVVALSALFQAGASYSWGQSSSNHVSSYNRVSYGSSGPSYSTSSYSRGPSYSTSSYNHGPSYSTTSYNSGPSYSTSYSSSPAHGYRSGSSTHSTSSYSSGSSYGRHKRSVYGAEPVVSTYAPVHTVSYSTPVHSTTPYAAPVHSTTSYAAPVHSTRSYAAPVHSTTSYAAPVRTVVHSSSYSAPVAHSQAASYGAMSTGLVLHGRTRNIKRGHGYKRSH